MSVAGFTTVANYANTTLGDALGVVASNETSLAGVGGSTVTVLSEIGRAILLLRSLGTSAHVWLPGANGVSVASLPSNNYLLSDGSTGYSTVDGVDGLTLDGVGALGSELVTNGSFATNDLTGWTTLAGTWNAATGVVVCTAGTNSTISQTILTLGRTYQITFDVLTLTGILRVYAGASVASTVSSTGTKTVYLRCLGDTVFYVQFSDGATGSVDNISVKEYTGTHLTQATTANKPLVRRGMLNLLTYSHDLSNAAWTKSVGTYVGTLFTAVSSAYNSVFQSVTTTSGGAYTLAVIASPGNQNKLSVEFRGAGTTPDAVFNTATGALISGAGSSALMADGRYLCVVNKAANSASSLAILGINGASTVVGESVNIHSTMIAPGTWTAAQILAEGGIPTTTATAASNPSAGKYWWSFDGSNDSLLSGNLGITNACTIVIAGRVNSLATIQMLFAEDSNGVRIFIATNGSIVVQKVDIVDAIASAAATLVAGVPFVLTIRLSGGTAVIRKNGVQVATNAIVLTFSAVTGARLGANFAGGQLLSGALGWVVPIAAALSDADCLTVERLVSSQFPNGPVF